MGNGVTLTPKTRMTKTEIKVYYIGGYYKINILYNMQLAQKRFYWWGVVVTVVNWFL